MAVICLLIAFMDVHCWLFPTPTDQFGLALRIRPAASSRIYLAMECVEQDDLNVLLISPSDKLQNPIKIIGAGRDGSGNLQISIADSMGKLVPPSVDGRVATVGTRFGECGYAWMPGPGTYQLKATLKAAEGMVVAPVFKFKVIEPSSEEILTSQQIPLEGQFSKGPKASQETAFVQQIKIGNCVWLFYRKFDSPSSGSAVNFAKRITELPGKVLDMKVEGAFGDWNPLTITYREHTYTKFTTKHVINSVDGRPWTAEEEKHRQERLKKLAPVHEKK